MLKRLIKQLRNVILLNHLLKLNSNAVWKDEIVACRIEELENEYKETQKYQELNVDYSRLYDSIYNDLIYNTDDEKQRYHVLFELDNLIVEMMDDVEAFYYLAGINDAMQIFKIRCP
jgi:hypothetical protein